jgi:hypothetical protein
VRNKPEIKQRTGALCRHTDFLLIARYFHSSSQLPCFNNLLLHSVTPTLCVACRFVACVDAVNRGAPDRRRHGANAKDFSIQTTEGTSRVLDPKKSLVGIVTLTPDTLLGCQENINVTDAAQGVLQSRVTAEWNGNGPLQSFADRAHRQWRRQRGMLDSSDDPRGSGTKRKLPKRIRPPSRRRPFRGIVMLSGGSTDAADERTYVEKLLDLIGFWFVIAYVVFHIRHGLLESVGGE